MIALFGLVSAAFAIDVSVADALSAELKRSFTELRLEDAPPLYHLRYHAVLLQQTDVRASFGAVVHENRNPFQAIGIELRVGTPAFDNTGFGGWQNGFGIAFLPDQITGDAVRTEAWRLTDRSYKQAIEQYARKTAQFSPPPDYPGDYLLTGPVFHDGGAGQGDPSKLTDVATAVSRALVVDASLDVAEVWVGHEMGTRILLDSEGTTVVEPMEECTLRAAVHAFAPDGQRLTDHVLWTVRHPEDLPPPGEMALAAKQTAAHLLALRDAPALAEEYVGPVLFEDSAARDLFRWLLIPQVEGTPPEVPFDSWFGELGGGAGATVRIGRRVLPDGWTAVDDPALEPEHPAHFTHDNEGTPAQSVPLVTDGIVRTLLMSRVPRAELAGSNGHARGSLGQRASGRAAVLTITPDRAVAARKLHKLALKEAADYGRDWYISIGRLQEPAVMALGGEYIDLPEGSLPPPVSVTQVFADGRRVELRGAALAAVHRWVLRDIVAAGPSSAGSFMASPDGTPATALGATEGLATWLSAPAVLIGEMEIVPASGDPRDLPVVPPPQLSQDP